MPFLNFIRNLLYIEFKNIMKSTEKNSFLKETSILLNEVFEMLLDQIDSLQIESNIIKNINAELIFIKL